jgi:predicted RNA-binding Zn-ribbon protein involved in translation (DUF1610 family)
MAQPLKYRKRMLPFWIKKICKKCGSKLSSENKTEIKEITGYGTMGSYAKSSGNHKPFQVKIVETVFTCPNCGSVFTIDDMLGRKPRQWYTEHKEE